MRIDHVWSEADSRSENDREQGRLSKERQALLVWARSASLRGLSVPARCHQSADCERKQVRQSVYVYVRQHVSAQQQYRQFVSCGIFEDETRSGPAATIRHARTRL